MSLLISGALQDYLYRFESHVQKRGILFLESVKKVKETFERIQVSFRSVVFVQSGDALTEGFQIRPGADRARVAFGIVDFLRQEHLTQILCMEKRRGEIFLNAEHLLRIVSRDVVILVKRLEVVWNVSFGVHIPISQQPRFKAVVDQKDAERAFQPARIGFNRLNRHAVTFPDGDVVGIENQNQPVDVAVTVDVGDGGSQDVLRRRVRVNAQNSRESAAAFHDVTISIVNAIYFRHASIRRLENAQPARQSFKKGSAVFKEEVYSHDYLGNRQ